MESTEKKVTYSPNFRNWARSLFPNNTKLHEAITNGLRFKVGEIIANEIKMYKQINLETLTSKHQQEDCEKIIIETFRRYKDLVNLQREWTYLCNRD